MTKKPASDMDLFSDEAIRNPYPFWKELRAMGPAVWLSRYDMWVVSRYDDVKAVLGQLADVHDRQRRCDGTEGQRGNLGAGKGELADKRPAAA